MTIEWTEEYDPAHPVPEGIQRFVAERHHHLVSHDLADEWITVAVTAVFRDFLGPHIEVGPWSLSASDARLFATSLTMLADTVDGVSR